MRGLLFSLFCLLLAACASQGPFPVSDSGARAQAEHLLAPGEKLRITTFGETSLTGEYTIGTAGDLAFPLVGTVQAAGKTRSEEHTSELQSLMRISYAVF